MMRSLMDPCASAHCAASFDVDPPSRPATRSRWRWRSLAPRMVICVGVVAFALLAVAGGPADAASSPLAIPYTDSSAVGYIGLCNAAGQQVTSGSVDAVPFTWRAVSSAPALAPYNNDWRTATLFAYQPQDGLVAGEWSGAELTASARYSNPEHPMAAATRGDESLEDYISDFPPTWDGFIELRIYLGTENAEPYSVHYPVLAIKVTGRTWHSVGGGPVNCDSGTAESIESILLPTSVTSPHPTGGASTSSGAHPTDTTSPSGSISASHPSTSGSHGTSTVALGASRASSSDAALIALIAAAVAAAAASLALVIRRRRLGRAAPSSATNPT